MNQLPEEIHRLKGTRPTRAAAPQEPVPAGRPTMPKHLSPIARDKWREMIRTLSSRGTLTRGDGPALEVFVETYARWRACLKEIDTHGVMVTVNYAGANGEPESKRVMNPASKLAAQLETSMRQMLKELGQTPASREKAKRAKPVPPKPRKLEPGEDPDPIDI